MPTYENMRKVMFYDVLMKLCQKIVKLHFESNAKKKMRKSLSKLMANNKLSPDSDQFKNELDNHLKVVKKSTYDREIGHIAEVLLQADQPRADLVRKLKEKNKALQKEYNHLVDTNVKVLGNEYFA